MLLPVPWLVDFAKTLSLVSMLTCAVPLAVGLRHWQRLELPLRVVVGTVLLAQGVLGLLSEASRYFWHYTGSFPHLIIWTETLGLSVAYLLVLRRPWPRQLLCGLLGLFLLVAAYETAGKTGYHDFGPPNMGTHILQFAVLFGAVLLYFDQILHELRAVLLERDPLFVLSVGVMFYYTGTVLVNVAADYMMLHVEAGIIWTMLLVQFVLLIFFNLLLATALRYAAQANTPGT